MKKLYNSIALIKYTLFLAGMLILTTEGISQCVGGASPVTTITVINPQSVDIAWTPATFTGPRAAGQPSGYLIEFNLTSATGWQPSGTGQIASSTGKINNLLPSRQYRVRVTAFATCLVDDPNVPGEKIEVADSQTGIENVFTTAAPPIPSLNVAACSSADPASVMVVWNGTTCDSYRLDISTVDSFAFGFVETDRAISPSTTTNFTKNGLAPGTNYFYRVRSHIAGLSSTSSGPSTAVPTRPEVPVSDQPPTSEITATTFKARWHSNNGNATSYRLDVSTVSDFSTLLTGFNNLVVNGTSQDVAGLTGGVTYHYRVRASTLTGTSTNSGPISVITIPSAPVSRNPDNITPTSFNAKWDAATGADSYRLDVSSNSAFTALVTGFNNLAVNGTAQNVANLIAGTTYFYRVRAVNTSGTSSSSTPITTITLPSAPVAAAASNFSTTSFTANWQAAIGAANYRLDVSTVSDFSTFITGFNNFTVANTSQVVNGLTAGLQYHYRIRAVNASGTSANSNATITKTISIPPTANNSGNVLTTSFVSSWNAITGAESYRLDVATDDLFTSMVTGYNNLVVDNTSQIINNLTAGSTYHYRVRAINVSGTSANSNRIATITLSSPPVAIAATGFTTTTFTANWNAAVGADHYKLDVSLADDFSTLLTDYNNLTVNGTAQSVSGLTSGLLYYYRIRAVNASGISDNSNTVTSKTVSPAPLAKTASNIQATSFLANWDAAQGAEGYRLDVATDESFTAVLTGYNNLQISTPNTSHSVAGLLPGRIYYYRVRTENSAGISGSSGSISQLTLPDAPVWKDTFVPPQPDRITVDWNASISAVGYELEVSSNNNFSDYVIGFAPKIIPASFNSEVVTGLNPTTTYYFRIKARNTSGLSAHSLVKAVSTTNSDGSIPSIELTLSSFSNTHLMGSAGQKNISITADRGLGSLTVDFYHRKKSEGDFTKETLAPSGNLYTATTKNEWFDDFGMEFYFEVHDLANQVKREPSAGATTHSVLTEVSSFTVPIDAFGPELKNYRIISFPYSLANMKIEDMLIPVIGEYDKSLWRFLQYRNGKNNDFLNDGLRISEVRQGEGYWFLSKNAVDLTFFNGRSHGNSIAEPFVMKLKEGWNQIGNPFPYNLSWQDVLDDNNNIESVSPLYVFDSPNISFAESDQLKVFGGGFVFAEEATELEFRVTLENAGGRVGIKSNSPTITEEANWLLPIALKQGDVTNLSGGIGMSANARDGKDSFDRVTVPRFVRFLELNSRVEEFDYSLSMNVVRDKEKFMWDFQIESNSSDDVTLQWDSEIISQLGMRLMLFDHSNHTVTDMALTDKHVTTAFAKISFYYERKSSDTNGVAGTALNVAYPNPFDNEVTIPLDYGFNDRYEAELSIVDVIGKIVFKQAIEMSGNLKYVKWNGKNSEGHEVPAGVYVFKISNAKNGKDGLCVGGRLIKK